MSDENEFFKICVINMSMSEHDSDLHREHAHVVIDEIQLISLHKHNLSVFHHEV